MPYGIWDGSSILAQFSTPLVVRSNQPVFSSDTLSLNRQISVRTAQRWEIEAPLEPLSSTANDLFVYITSKGHGSLVQAIMPQNYAAVMKRTATGIPQVNATAVDSPTVYVNATGGWTGMIPKGTFIRFSNVPHDKVYLVLNDTTPNSTMSIYPNLRSAVSLSNTFKYKDDVLLNALFDLDVIRGMMYVDGILMNNGTIKLVEKLI